MRVLPAHLEAASHDLLSLNRKRLSDVEKKEYDRIKLTADFVANVRNRWDFPSWFTLDHPYFAHDNLDRLKDADPEMIRVLARQLTLKSQRYPVGAYRPLWKTNSAKNPLGGILAYSDNLLQHIECSFAQPARKTSSSLLELRNWILRDLVFINFFLERCPQFFSEYEVTYFNEVSNKFFICFPSNKGLAQKLGMKVEPDEIEETDNC